MPVVDASTNRAWARPRAAARKLLASALVSGRVSGRFRYQGQPSVRLRSSNATWRPARGAPRRMARAKQSEAAERSRAIVRRPRAWL